MAELHFQAMTTSELDQVLEIETRSQAFPWSRQQFVDSLNEGHAIWLALEDQKLLGYSVTMNVVDEMHLLNIAVTPEAQGKGYGSALLQHALESAKRQGSVRMILEVRASNAAALTLYRRQGFANIGQRRNYYVNGADKEDAIVMACNL